MEKAVRTRSGTFNRQQLGNLFGIDLSDWQWELMLHVFDGGQLALDNGRRDGGGVSPGRNVWNWNALASNRGRTRPIRGDGITNPPADWQSAVEFEVRVDPWGNTWQLLPADRFEGDQRISWYCT